MAETQYQKRTKVRRMSDIERLAREYSKNVQAMTGQYEQSYADYQKNVATQMAPYEAEVARYQQELMPTYETQAANYKTRLSQYQQALKDFEQNKVVEWVPANVAATTTSRRGRVSSYIDVPTWFEDYNRSKYMPSGESYSGRLGAEMMIARGGLPLKQEGGTFYLGRLAQLPERLSEKAPTAPSAPVRPEIKEFDTSAFAAKKAEAETTFKREVGERKAARLGAVSRRATRPMLQES